MGEDEKSSFIANCHTSFGEDLALQLQQKLVLRRSVVLIISHSKP